MGKRPEQSRAVNGSKDLRVFEKPHDYFYDLNEQQNIRAAVVMGHLSSFTQSGPITVQAHSRILVFQTGGPKAPAWWRKQLGNHVAASAPRVSYIVIACIPPERVDLGLFGRVDAAIEEFGENVVELHILEEQPQLAFDIMVVDGEHIFLALQSDIDLRQCSIYMQDRTVARTLEEWLLRLLSRAAPYSRWKQAHFLRLKRPA